LVEEGGVHEAVFVARIVPEEHAGFLLLGAGDGFRLEVGAGFAVELVGYGYVGGLVECHQAGQFGEDGCDQRIDRSRDRESGGVDLDGWVAIGGMDAGDGDVGVGGFQGIERGGRGAVEGDYLTADGKVVTIQCVSQWFCYDMMFDLPAQLQ